MGKKVQFSEKDYDSQVLKCPRCGYVYTHQEVYEIWNRKEDSDEGMHCLVNGTEVKIDSDASTGNPSSRRQAISISFWCESCGVRSILDIVQHKGLTLVEWRDEGSNEETEETNG